MQPDYKEIFLKSYFSAEERDQSENDSGTSEDIHSSEVCRDKKLTLFKTRRKLFDCITKKYRTILTSLRTCGFPSHSTTPFN